MKISCLIILFSGIFMLACNDEIKQPEEDYSLYKDAEFIKDIRLNYSDSAVLKAVVTGPEMWRYKGGEREVFPKGIHATFYNHSDNPSSYLHARKAFRFQRKKQIILEDHVVLYNLEGDSLFTSQLTWDEKEDKIFTDRFVRLTKRDRVILGYGFESTQDFTKGRIKAVEGTWRLDEE